MILSCKRGQGHIEIMLSMIIFVGFLIFVFIFMNPFIKIKKEPQMVDIQEAVFNSISSDVGVLSVILNSSGNCYSLDDINSAFGNKFIEVHDIDNPRRYTIYYGDFFEPSMVGGKSCSCDAGNPGLPLENCEDSDGNKLYALGLYVEDKIVVYESIQELKSLYEADYEGLRRSLKVRDFSFSLRNINGGEIAVLTPLIRNVPSGSSVNSKDLFVRVIDKDGKIQELILNLKAW